MLWCLCLKSLKRSTIRIVPTISVIIPAYQEGALLREAVASARRQSLPPDEVIVVNDGSAHALTNEVCRSLEAAGEAKIIWLSANGGPSVARNAGVSASAGEIIVPLDADDVLPPNALASIHEAFRKHPDSGFVYGSYVRMNSRGMRHVVTAAPLSLRSLLRARPWALGTNWSLLGTTPLRRSLWDAVGGFDCQLGVTELHDVDFWVRALARPCTFARTEDVIYVWRKHLGSNSSYISPSSWSRLAHKHRAIFAQHGLDYRATELMLLGGMWEGNAEEIRRWRRALLQSIMRLRVQLSSVVFVAAPAWLFRLVVRTWKPYTS